MSKCRIRVVCAADGRPTPHDGRYVVSWSPHTPYGVLQMVSTDQKSEATIFDFPAVWEEWKTISNVQKFRPDNEPNRPLMALSVEFERVYAS